MSKIKSVLALVLVAALCFVGASTRFFDRSVSVAQQPVSADRPTQAATTVSDGKQPAAVAIPDKEKLAALERKLAGAWIGHGPCVGDSVFQLDGTYHRFGYGPGAGHFESGKWKIEWNELPPTLVLTESPTETKYSEEPFKVRLVKLNDKQLDYRWSRYEDSRIEEHLRGTELDNVTIRIRILDSAVQRYLGNEDHGAGINFPPNLKALVDANILSSESLVDPYGHQFRYDVSGKRNKGKRPDIWTETPDKKIIDNWTTGE
ncbi:MAG: hypothetical protein NT069_01490 [Planctomycetota bacterium]|nr:hypothetical protein [Planctomycetota bacterium]